MKGNNTNNRKYSSVGFKRHPVFAGKPIAEAKILREYKTTKIDLDSWH